MMRSIVQASLRFRLLVVGIALAILVVGASQLRKMPVDVLPEFVPPTVEIQTEALGLSAAEVEQLITVPMEQDLLAGVAFLDDLRSESLPGLSRVFLVFEPGTDLFHARQVVAERLTQAHALPNVSKPPLMLQPLSSTNRVMIIGASTNTLSPIEMGVLARWTIVPKLIGVEGVANVSVWGFRDRQLQVQVDPERLRDRDVTLTQVVETTGNSLWFSPLTFVEASTPGVGGFIDTPNQRLGVQHLSPISSAEDLAKVRVQGTVDRPLVLGDVATVVEDHQPLIGDALVAQRDGDLLFVVEKLPAANALDVTRRLEAAVDALRPGSSGVEFDTTVYRPASYLETATDNVGLVALVGVLLAALVIAGFFLRWQTALIAIVAIPLSLIAAALALWLLGTTMNTIVLLGLAAGLAIVVDDAVVAVDGIVRRLREHRAAGDGASPAAIVLDATLRTRSVTAYAMLILALALLPAFFAKEVAGSFLPDVAGAFLLAVLASMVVASTVAPALAVLLLSRAPLDRESPLAAWLARGYERALAWILSRPLWAYGAAALVVVATVVAVPFLSTSLLPTLKERQVLIRWDGPPGTSLPEMNRITGLASRELGALPGVETVGAHVGRAVASDLSVNANSAELWVTIDPSADYDATLRSIREVVNGYPGLSPLVGAFSNERVRAVLSGDGRSEDVVVRLYGEDPEVLVAQADRVRQTVAGVDGIAEAIVELPSMEPTIEVEVDLARAEARGIKPGDVRRSAATLLGGLVVGNLFEQQKVFEVVVWGTPETRNSLSSIRNLLIDTPEGGHVRLDEVADVRIAPNPTVIDRHAVSRYLDIVATVAGRDRDAAADDARSRLAELGLPLEYHTEILASGGQAWGRLILLALAAAAGILLLLQAAFGSWRLAALTFVTFPFAVTGGVLGALAAGGTISFGTLIGWAAVFGIAARAGMLLVDRLRHLELSEGVPFGRELVIRGARDRVVPIIVTALAAGLALIPALVTGAPPGQELIHPLAIAVLGGLVTSTALVLFILPLLYLRLGSVGAPAPDALLEPGREPVPARDGREREQVASGVAMADAPTPEASS